MIVHMRVAWPQYIYHYWTDSIGGAASHLRKHEKHTYRVVMEAYTDCIGGAASHLRKHEKAHLAGRDGSLHNGYLPLYKSDCLSDRKMNRTQKL